MRRAATTWLTIIGVLWHAAVGCCAHHAHAADEHRVTPSAVAVEEHAEHAAAAHKGCRGHHHADHDLLATAESQRPAEHDDSPTHEPCEETTCSFLGAKPTAAIEIAGQTATGAWLSTVTACETISALTQGRLAQRYDDRPPPLRTHLALHVLLI